MLDYGKLLFSLKLPLESQRNMLIELKIQHISKSLVQIKVFRIKIQTNCLMQIYFKKMFKSSTNFRNIVHTVCCGSAFAWLCRIRLLSANFTGSKWHVIVEKWLRNIQFCIHQKRGSKFIVLIFRTGHASLIPLGRVIFVGDFQCCQITRSSVPLVE